MPREIITISGSRSINFVNFNLYMDKNKIDKLILGGAIGVDSLAEQWAKNNKINFIVFKPNYKIYGKSAPLTRDREMVDAADKLIAFWDGKSTGTKYTIDYAIKMGRKVEVNVINEVI